MIKSLTHVVVLLIMLLGGSTTETEHCWDKVDSLSLPGEVYDVCYVQDHDLVVGTTALEGAIWSWSPQAKTVSPIIASYLHSPFPVITERGIYYGALTPDDAPVLYVENEVEFCFNHRHTTSEEVSGVFSRYHGHLSLATTDKDDSTEIIWHEDRVQILGAYGNHVIYTDQITWVAVDETNGNLYLHILTDKNYISITLTRSEDPLTTVYCIPDRLVALIPYENKIYGISERGHIFCKSIDRTEEERTAACRT